MRGKDNDEPGPDRALDSWADFLKRHSETLWTCDCFTVKTVTSRGLRDMDVLVLLCLESREVIVSPATGHPNSARVVRQAEAFIDQTANFKARPDTVMHDRDTKFTKEFAANLKHDGMRTNPLLTASPNLNGRCERVIQAIKYECQAKFIIF